jgi:hypothetical protein
VGAGEIFFGLLYFIFSWPTVLGFLFLLWLGKAQKNMVFFYPTPQTNFPQATFFKTLNLLMKLGMNKLTLWLLQSKHI